MPIALTDMTDTDPTVEQIERKMSGFFLPYNGATLYIMTTAKTPTIRQKMRNPATIIRHQLSPTFQCIGPGLSA
jgi:hypothetical protein